MVTSNASLAHQTRARRTRVGTREAAAARPLDPEATSAARVLGPGPEPRAKLPLVRRVRFLGVCVCVRDKSHVCEVAPLTVPER